MLLFCFYKRSCKKAAVGLSISGTERKDSFWIGFGVYGICHQAGLFCTCYLQKGDPFSLLPNAWSEFFLLWVIHISKGPYRGLSFFPKPPGIRFLRKAGFEPAELRALQAQFAQPYLWHTLWNVLVHRGEALPLWQLKHPPEVTLQAYFTINKLRFHGKKAANS